MDSEHTPMAVPPSAPSEATMAESPTSTTATPMKKAPAAENLYWASLIKEQHRHLQGVVLAASQQQQHPKAAESSSTAASAAAPPASWLPHERDLEAWKAALDGTEASKRLSAYSIAMHHLSTQYWSPLSGIASGTDVQFEAFSEAEPSADKLRGSSTSSQDAPCTQHIGEKRQRRASCVSGEEVTLNAEGTARFERGEAVTTSRRYSDRLQYCVRSTASYFLGVAVSTAQSTEFPMAAETIGADEHRGGSSETRRASAKGQRNKEAPQSLLIPVYGTAYSTLPGVMARVIKPLRRAFFNLYDRMATGEEVGQLIQACTPDEAVPTTATVAASGASDASASSLSTVADAFAPCEREATWVQKLMTTHPDGRGVERDFSWRLGAGTGWAAALCYAISSTPQVADQTDRHFGFASSSLPPPLYVLDVGSCYGPFHGKCLPRPPPLPSVPLRVTSIDLAPYLDDTQAALDSSQEPPAPRVWQGDWLQMQFFSEEEAVHGSTWHEGVKRAEDGRVWYSLPSVSGTPASHRQKDSTQDEARVKDDVEAASSKASPSSRTSPGTASRTGTTTSAVPLSVVALQLESYDAVFFCLLLSYLPTPRLRLLACLHACLALKEGGLLVIVSTRTQGSRRRNWMQEWAACLATIGFQRVEQSTQEKIVGMAFAKVCPSRALRDSWKTAEGRIDWIRAMMTTPAAENGLCITADDAQDRGYI